MLQFHWPIPELALPPPMKESLTDPLLPFLLSSPSFLPFRCLLPSPHAPRLPPAVTLFLSLRATSPMSSQRKWPTWKAWWRTWTPSPQPHDHWCNVQAQTRPLCHSHKHTHKYTTKPCRTRGQWTQKPACCAGRSSGVPTADKRSKPPDWNFLQTPTLAQSQEGDCHEREGNVGSFTAYEETFTFRSPFNRKIVNFWGVFFLSAKICTVGVWAEHSLKDGRVGVTTRGGRPKIGWFWCWCSCSTVYTQCLFD